MTLQTCPVRGCTGRGSFLLIQVEPAVADLAAVMLAAHDARKIKREPARHRNGGNKPRLPAAFGLRIDDACPERHGVVGLPIRIDDADGSALFICSVPVLHGGRRGIAGPCAAFRRDQWQSGRNRLASADRPRTDFSAPTLPDASR